MRSTARAAALIPLAVAGCAFGPRNRTARAAAAAGAATLEVSNGYQGPVDVYVLRGGTGTPARLGQVPTGRVQRYRVDANLIGGFGTVTFVARPPASQTRASTGAVPVRAGDVVRFNVTPDLRSSTVFVE
jgi:hypothetical protein